MHARNSAIDTLIKLYLHAEKNGYLARLDLGIRNFVEELKARNQGSLPEPKGGRPFGERVKRLKLAIKAQEAIEAHGKKRGSVEAALLEAADREGVTYNYLKEIHYDPDPEWRLAVKAERALMKLREYEEAIDAAKSDKKA
jgi:hypothetical protein